MNINDFLATLDYEQLGYCKRRAEELMNKKEEETMIPLWVIADEDINYAWFREDDYQAAVDRLVREIREEAAQRRGNLDFYLMKRRYRESEVAELLLCSQVKED